MEKTAQACICDKIIKPSTMSIIPGSRARYHNWKCPLFVPPDQSRDRDASDSGSMRLEQARMTPMRDLWREKMRLDPRKGNYIDDFPS